MFVRQAAIFRLWRSKVSGLCSVFVDVSKVREHRSRNADAVAITVLSLPKGGSEGMAARGPSRSHSGGGRTKPGTKKGRDGERGRNQAQGQREQALGDEPWSRGECFRAVGMRGERTHRPCRRGRPHSPANPGIFGRRRGLPGLQLPSGSTKPTAGERNPHITLPKPKKKLTPEQRREKKRRKAEFETIFVDGNIPF